MNTNKLFELRDYNNLSQTEIASKIGVSQQLYSFWENGSKIIPLKHLNDICNYYKVSMNYVLNINECKDLTFIEANSLDKVAIGKRIKEIREKNNITVRDLASELNTTSSTISAYETGKTLILTAFAYQICKKYNVSLDWLCGRTKK